MNKEKIKELVNVLHQYNYKDFFGALMVYENINYLMELEDLTDAEIDYLEKLYDVFMASNDIQLINADAILEREREEK